MTFEEKKMIRQSLLVPLLSLPCSYPSNLGEIQPMQLEYYIIAPVMNAVKEGKIPDCDPHLALEQRKLSVEYADNKAWHTLETVFR